MATSAYQKQYQGRGKKARAALARADRNARKRLGRVVEGLPALAVVVDVAGGRALAGEAIFGEVPTGPPPAPLRLTGAALRGVNPADGGFTVLKGQVTATGGTGAVAVRITIDHFVDGGTHQSGAAFRYALGTRYVAGMRQYRAAVVGQPSLFVTGAFTVE